MFRCSPMEDTPIGAPALEMKRDARRETILVLSILDYRKRILSVRLLASRRRKTAAGKATGVGAVAAIRHCQRTAVSETDGDEG